MVLINQIAMVKFRVEKDLCRLVLGCTQGQMQFKKDRLFFKLHNSITNYGPWKNH